MLAVRTEPPELEYYSARIHSKREVIVDSDGLASLIHVQSMLLKYGSKSELDARYKIEKLLSFRIERINLRFH